MSRRVALWIAFVVVHLGVAALGFAEPNMPMGDVYIVYEPWSSSALGGDGIIENGRELFGTGTFWMLFRDGYAAMRSLDTNADGWLSGPELTGVVVWLDSNLNAKSELGEVVEVRRAGIASIKVTPDAAATKLLEARTGIVWQDGHVSPTYDWVVQPKKA